MAVIKVPRTPKTAFNQNRPPSALLLNQIEHLEWALLPASQRKPDQLPKQKVTTEGQAAERVAQLTALLRAPESTTAQGAGAQERGRPSRVTLPPLPPVPTGGPAAGPRKKSRKPAKKAKTAKSRRRSAGSAARKRAAGTRRAATRGRTRR